MQIKYFAILLILSISFAGVMSKKKVAGLVVFRRIDSTNRFLMLKPQSDKKDWSPPKGRLDKDEDYFEAAVRETEEETGYTVDDLKIFKDESSSLHLSTKSGKNKTVKFWLAELINEEKEPHLSSEHSTYRWCTKEEAISLCDLPAFTDALNGFDDATRTV